MLMRRIVLLGSLCGILLITGCKDGNLFGGLHKRGDSGNIEYLLSDASVALKEKDYTGALSLYEKVLAQDPNNSEALYGAATAAIATSGLNFGLLLSNVVSQSSVSSFDGLQESIAQARETIGSSSAGPNSILAGVNVAALNAVIDTAICRLGSIVKNQSDGNIANDDVDVLINLAFLHIVRAISKPIEHDLVDITNNGGNYQVDVQSIDDNYCNGTTVFGGISSPANRRAFFVRVMQDAASSHLLLTKVISKLNLASDKVIPKVRTDISDAVTDLLADVGVPFGDCQDRFDEAGISVIGDLGNLTFSDYAALNPSSGC